MGTRLEGDAADNAAHKVETELKMPPSEQATQALRDTFLTLSAASPSVQQEFLRDLNQDDPKAMEKVKSLIPELTISGGDDQLMKMNTNNQSTVERAGTWAAANIIEDGAFGNNNERNYFKSAMIESSPAELVKTINHDLAAAGDTSHQVSMEKTNANDPSELVLRDSGHKTDAIVKFENH